MTDQPVPPPDKAPVQQLLVAPVRGRVPRPRGLSTVVLAIIVAVLCAYVAVLLIGQRQGDAERRQLACEVQRLGGRPVGDVDCPTPRPSPQTSPRPTPALSPTPAPTVVVVMPSAARGPAGPRGARGPAGPPGGPTPRASASRPPASPAARPSPTPSCRRPNPLPVGPACLPGGRPAGT